MKKHGTLKTTAQHGAETGGEHDDIVVSAETRDHFGQAAWLVRKAIAHLLLIDAPELGYEPDLLQHDLEEVQQELERCHQYKVWRNPVLQVVREEAVLDRNL